MTWPSWTTSQTSSAACTASPGAYGVVTMPFSVREGINIFLSGFVPTENLRFREEALTFKVGLLLSPCLRCKLIFSSLAFCLCAH